ncbi:major facilitator superfamily domain-containing protein 6-like [Amphiura filiformis]|uniref:major facilitator superfamily domain-containing protein 6-like n=1 Tax=Amphiura filiformis TaxID=82378 RepID=UPI003B224822
MTSNRDQLDRTLSEYDYLLSDRETTGSDLPAILQESRQDSENSHYDMYEESKSSSQFALVNISKQSKLFAFFFVITHFAREVLHPYISVYLRQLGFNAKEIGYIGCVQPFVAIFYTSFIGYIADKYSINRYLLTGSLATGFIHMAMYYVPTIRPKDCIDICSVNISSSTIPEYQTDCSSFATPPSTIKNMQRTIYSTSDLHVVFVYLIFVNIVTQLLGAPWFPLANGYLLAVLGSEKRNQYAYFKGFGGLGQIIGGMVAGVTLHMTVYTYTHCFIDVNQTRFLACFLMYSVAMFIAAPVGWWMVNEPGDKEKMKTNKTYTLATFAGALLKLRYISVVIVIMWLAIVAGKLRTFDFWYINVLGGSYLMMGWGGSISKVCGTATCFCLPYLNAHIGHIPLLVAACIGMGASCIIASMTENVTWMVVPLLFREIAIAISGQAQGAFLGNAVENQYQATLQSVMSTLTFGVGNGLGSLLGGELIEDISAEMSYYIFAIISFIMAVFLILAQIFVKATL